MYFQAFVYAIVRTSAARVLEDKDIVYEDYEPQILPQPLCSTLSLPVQQEWWTCAYNLYTGKYRYKFVQVEGCDQTVFIPGVCLSSCGKFLGFKAYSYNSGKMEY